MKVFDKETHGAVEQAVARTERTTDAELVTVLARQADEYHWVGLFWAALVALLVPGIIFFFPAWFGLQTMLLIQWGTFFVLGVLFQIPAVTIKLVPRHLRHARAAALARVQFLEQNLHRTEHAVGLLIFVSEAERYVEIIADQGIAERVDNAQWEAIIKRFTERVVAGETRAGFVECVESCGALLAEVLPATEKKNELPNRLVILD